MTERQPFNPHDYTADQLWDRVIDNVARLPGLYVQVAAPYETRDFPGILANLRWENSDNTRFVESRNTNYFFGDRASMLAAFESVRASMHAPRPLRYIGDNVVTHGAYSGGQTIVDGNPDRARQQHPAVVPELIKRTGHLIVGHRQSQEQDFERAHIATFRSPQSSSVYYTNLYQLTYFAAEVANNLGDPEEIALAEQLHAAVRAPKVSRPAPDPLPAHMRWLHPSAGSDNATP